MLGPAPDLYIVFTSTATLLGRSSRDIDGHIRLISLYVDLFFTFTLFLPRTKPLIRLTACAYTSTRS